MKKAAGVIGIILAVVFLILGFTTQIPDKYIKSYGTDKMEEYVGGDAYNFIIEASLRGGEIAGARTAKTIYFAVAAILGVLSISFLNDDSSESLRNDLSSIRSEINNSTKSIDQLNETLKQQKASLQDALSEVLENQTTRLTEVINPSINEQNNHDVNEESN